MCVYARVLINRLFKAVREPTVPQHSYHRGGRALQVFKRIHQDEVQHNVKKVHRHHLPRSQQKIHNNAFYTN